MSLGLLFRTLRGRGVKSWCVFPTCAHTTQDPVLKRRSLIPAVWRWVVKAAPNSRLVWATPTFRAGLTAEAQGPRSVLLHCLLCVGSHCPIGLLVSTKDFDSCNVLFKDIFIPGKEGKSRKGSENKEHLWHQTKFRSLVCPSLHRLPTPVTSGG